MPFALKKYYNFNTLAGVMLGQSYSSVKVISIMDSKRAVEYRDIMTMHANVRTLITNLPSSVEDLTYVLFENTDGEKLLLALEYIDLASVVEVANINAVIKVYDINTEDLSILRKAISELGFANVQISTESN